MRPSKPLLQLLGGLLALALLLVPLRLGEWEMAAHLTVLFWLSGLLLAGTVVPCVGFAAWWLLSE